jgi:asparagine synthase (glutamine-hydrolysing)
MSTVRDFVLYNACDTLPSDLAGLGLNTERPAYRDRVLTEAEALYPRDRMRQAMYSDQHTFLCSLLDRNDRMTMGASIECRVPFLDYRLVEGLAALPSSQLLAGEGNKPLLRRSLGDRLPDDVLRHPKWGFGVPWRKYLRTIPELRSLVLSLARHPLLLDSPIDTGRLTRRVAAFDGGDDEHCPLVLQLLLATQAWDASRTATRLSA